MFSKDDMIIHSLNKYLSGSIVSGIMPGMHNELQMASLLNR